MLKYDEIQILIPWTYIFFTSIYISIQWIFLSFTTQNIVDTFQYDIHVGLKMIEVTTDITILCLFPYPYFIILSMTF